MFYHIFYFPQYGYCQTFKLPCGEFQLSKNPEKEGREALETYKQSDDHGYILEVDLIYPPELHDQHPHFENPLGEYIKYQYIFPKSNYLLHIYILQLRICLYYNMMIYPTNPKRCLP